MEKLLAISIEIADAMVAIFTAPTISDWIRIAAYFFYPPKIPQPRRYC